MKKKRRKFMPFTALIIVLVVLGIGTYYPYEKTKASVQGGGGTQTRVLNPVYGVNDKEALENFDESYVYYLLISIKANKLHNPPFSSDTPKIEVNLGDEVYSAEVVKGKIIVKKGDIAGEDIIIWSSKEEIVGMMKDPSYARSSFTDGRSSVEMIAGEIELYSKGYLDLYSEVTGKNLT